MFDVATGRIDGGSIFIICLMIGLAIKYRKDWL